MCINKKKYIYIYMYIRRPRPEPWPGRRLGPPLVWTSSAAKLRAVASQVFLFLAKPTASNAPNLPNELLELQKLEAVASQVVPFLVPNFCCQTSGCGKPSLFVSTGPKLPDAPSKPCKPLKLPKRATAALGAAKLEAVASQVVPFLVKN